MPTTTARYKDFLSSYKFYPNSINFRIVSSKSIERWKNVQSFQLSQLIKGKFFFSKDRREILLQQYDLWSRFLYEVENFCIERSGDENKLTTSEDVDLVLVLADKTSALYKRLMLVDYNHRFENVFLKIWLEIHETPYRYLIQEIKLLAGLPFEDFFAKLVSVLIAVMQYTLIEIHELDMLLCKVEGPGAGVFPSTERLTLPKDTIPFVIITSLVDRVFAMTGSCLVCERLKVYRKYIDLDEIYLKNYTDAPVNARLIENIERNGFKVNFRKSMLGE